MIWWCRVTSVGQLLISVHVYDLNRYHIFGIYNRLIILEYLAVFAQNITATSSLILGITRRIEPIYPHRYVQHHRHYSKHRRLCLHTLRCGNRCCCSHSDNFLCVVNGMLHLLLHAVAVQIGGKWSGRS